jgi:hypothetical protein
MVTLFTRTAHRCPLPPPIIRRRSRSSASTSARDCVGCGANSVQGH